MSSEKIYILRKGVSLGLKVKKTGRKGTGGKVARRRDRIN